MSWFAYRASSAYSSETKERWNIVSWRLNHQESSNSLLNRRISLNSSKLDFIRLPTRPIHSSFYTIISNFNIKMNRYAERCSESALTVLWNCSKTKFSKNCSLNALKPLWNWYETDLRLKMLWYCSDFAPKLI